MTRLLKILLPLIILPSGTFAQGDTSQIDWVSYEKAITLAQNHNQKVLLFMEADWCSVCKRMKREVFPDKEIKTLMNDHFLPVRIDIESEDKILFQGREISKKNLAKDLGIYGTPTIIFLEENESVIGNNVGFMNTDNFKRLLTFIYQEEYLHSNFDNN
ncbi:MAG: thioredoxin fold domain-containing protein [Balneolaceae bacterium]|nr:thioredoxin fold domain-containing protein [Balneolaceae bacterium]